ncbi:acyltransferase [Hortaea werneckii]|nr:acyltransferase [Hortaea werneckii]KAI7069819.1 acyltransferase [Hortaea werneckii]KAI7221607.1 acyltransferase [Hortaea werneckii]KAI7300020.1 acyltransferase [Hortaea werneckii]KAI7388251.1 acyltransferase [Hortaea werneckii]
MSRTPPPPPPHSPPPDLAIVGNTLQIHPSSIADTPFASQEQSLLEPYARFRRQPINALQELGLHVLGEGWRSYDDIVGQEIFYPGFSENMKGMVMAQERLQRKIAELAGKRVEVEIHEGLLGPKGPEGEAHEHRKRRLERRREIEAQLREVAEDWTDKMICKMESKYFIRSAYYLCTQLLTRAYHQGIHVSSDEVLHLRSVAAEAAKKKQSIIFLPCHKSHVDYVSLQLICYRLGLALPTVVAGDNLNFPVVGSFLQHAGAMWIRRSFGDDQLYTTLVQSYMDTLLQNGYNIECFVEGGRSRTGKLLQPKFGILSFLLDSVLSGRVEDAIVCPVSTQYDKVIEVDSYVSELLGQPKPKEDLASFLSASSVLSLKLGRVDVRFHEPWSLRGFIDEHRSRLLQKSLPSVGEMKVDLALKRRLLTTLGYKVLSDINDASVVMPTALVGTILLTLRGRGVGKSELVRRVEWLSDRVRSQGGRVAHFAGQSTEAVVDKALEVLGTNLVGDVPGLPESTFYAQDRFQLSFYRNMTIHLFVSQALVCAAMYTKVKLGSSGGSGEEEKPSQRMSYQDLYDYTFFLSQLFRAEFIFPTTPLAENLKGTLKGLEEDCILKTYPITATADRQNDSGSSSSEQMEVETQIDSIGLHPLERANGRESYDFYCFLIWPFVEASWLGNLSLFMLTPPTSLSSPTKNTNATSDTQDNGIWLDLKLVQTKAQLLGKTLYHQGDLSYFEAVNKEALANSFSRSEEAGIILIDRPSSHSSSSAAGSQPSGPTPPPSSTKSTTTKVRLHPSWTPPRDSTTGHLLPEGRLWDFCERISQARREGKNRRDGASVRRRVLGLVEMVGSSLFDQEDGGSGREARSRL